jgi:DNA replication protein DnaC
LPGILEYERKGLASRGIPERYLEVIYGSCQDTEAVSLAISHAAEVARGACLVLSGPVGIGKTVAAVRLARYLYRLGKEGMFVPARELDMDKNKDMGYLVIDDLGTERFPQDVEFVLEHRHAHMRPTVITTNLTLEAVRRTYGERLVDRFREWAIFYELKGTSLRRKT